MNNITYEKLPAVVKEKEVEYSVSETVTQEDLELLKELKDMGIDSIEKLKISVISRILLRMRILLEILNKY